VLFFVLFVPSVPFVALLGFEVGVEMRTVQRGHSYLVALARRFRCLPVLDELRAQSVIPKRCVSGVSNVIHQDVEAGAGVARYVGYLNCPEHYVGDILPLSQWSDWTGVNVELEWNSRSTFYCVPDEHRRCVHVDRLVEAGDGPCSDRQGPIHERYGVVRARQTARNDCVRS